MAFGVHDHPFYRPLVRRVIIVAVAVVWSAMELFYVADGFWSLVAVAVCAYCIWAFLIAYPKPSNNTSGNTGES